MPEAVFRAPVPAEEPECDVDDVPLGEEELTAAVAALRAGLQAQFSDRGRSR